MKPARRCCRIAPNAVGTGQVPTPAKVLNTHAVFSFSL